MIDLALLKDPKGVELVKESERKRFNGVERVERVVEMICQRNILRFKIDEFNKEENKISKEIGRMIKTKEGTQEEKAQLINTKQEAEKGKLQTKKLLEELEQETNKEAREIGNILSSIVHTDTNEDNNPVVFKRKHAAKSFHPLKMLPFHEIMEKLGAIESKKGTLIAGHRGYFLKNEGVVLAQSLARYGMDFLRKKEYTLLQTPFMMSGELMGKTAQLSDFGEQLYKIEEKDMYLIATSEQPISALHHNEWIQATDLPIRYSGYSTCFRKEAGAHGKDNKGLFRVHQFEKVEQFVICSPDTSDAEFQKMVECSREFYDSLELDYRVVSIVSGALNNAAAVKYDLEAYFPMHKEGEGGYRELVSCSNCTDYQSRDLNIRYGLVDSGEKTKKFVHMLNGTLCAVQRALCCILENYQTENGVKVPSVLIPYVGKDFIPYTN
ncbi:seryl-tRNA synthetase [Nematocida sp. AWRm77]|nr:seryl-tRNA synthetase [Nematocida sp. AWRm77]